MNKSELKIISTEKAHSYRPDGEIYKRALLKLVDDYNDLKDFGSMEDWRNDKRGAFEKYLFLAVRLICNGKNQRKEVSTLEEAEEWMHYLFSTMDLFSMLTPLELMQMFPVTKEYDGAKWQTKDYFYTMKELEKLDFNSPIGQQADVFEVLTDYQNHDIDHFVVEVMMAMSTVRKFQGQPGIMEEFLADQGVTPVIFHEKEGYIYDPATGKSQPVQKPKKRMPKWMRIVE